MAHAHEPPEYPGPAVSALVATLAVAGAAVTSYPFVAPPIFNRYEGSGRVALAVFVSLVWTAAFAASLLHPRAAGGE